MNKKKSLHDKLKDFRKRAALVLLSGVLAVNMFGCKNEKHNHSTSQSNDISNGFTFEPIPSHIPDSSIEDVIVLPEEPDIESWIENRPDVELEEETPNDKELEDTKEEIKKEDGNITPSIPSVKPTPIPESKPNEEELPEINEDPELVPHTHEFGDWFMYDEVYEERDCKYCPQADLQEHYFNVLNNYIYNYDNTYQQDTEYVCSSCGYTKTETKVLEDIEFTEWVYNENTKLDERKSTNYDYQETRVHEHNMEIKSYDSIYEYQECSICGEKVQVKHNLDNGTYKNGKKVYECLNDGCDYTKTVTPSHGHSGNSTPSTPEHKHTLEFRSNNGDLGEIWGCKEDSYTETKEHNLDSGVIEGDITTYTCLTPGCGYTKEVKKEHIHDYVFNQNLGETGEEWICLEDNVTETRSHKLPSEGIVQSDGSTEFACETLGCGYKKVVPKEHVHNSVFKENKGVEGELWGCSEDNDVDELKEHQLTAGTYVKDRNATVKSCETLGCDYEEAISHTAHDYFVASHDADKEYLECSICGDTNTRNHTFPTVGEPDGERVKYQCETCDEVKYSSTHKHTIVTEITTIATETQCQRIYIHCNSCEYVQSDTITEHKPVSGLGGRIRCSECQRILYDPNSIREVLNFDESILDCDTANTNECNFDLDNGNDMVLNRIKR